MNMHDQVIIYIDCDQRLALVYSHRINPRYTDLYSARPGNAPYYRRENGHRVQRATIECEPVLMETVDWIHVSLVLRHKTNADNE